MPPNSKRSLGTYDKLWRWFGCFEQIDGSGQGNAYLCNAKERMSLLFGVQHITLQSTAYINIQLIQSLLDLIQRLDPSSYEMRNETQSR